MVHLSSEDHPVNLTVSAWWPVIFLAIVPYLWWIGRRTVTDLSPRHIQVSTLIRSAIVVLLAFSLMQPVLYRAATDFSVVYLVDLSQSVSAPAIQAALDWIGKTNATGKPAHSGLVPFAANSQYF